MGNKHEKLLERMRCSQAGWKASDFESLYLGFGFQKNEGGRHTMYYHESYPVLVATVSRSSGELSKAYAAAAIKLLDELKRIQEQSDNDDDADRDQNRVRPSDVGGNAV